MRASERERERGGGERDRQTEGGEILCFVFYCLDINELRQRYN